MALAHGNRVLEVPFVDHDIGPQLLFHFVADALPGWRPECRSVFVRKSLAR